MDKFSPNLRLIDSLPTEARIRAWLRRGSTHATRSVQAFGFLIFDHKRKPGSAVITGSASFVSGWLNDLPADHLSISSTHQSDESCLLCLSKRHARTA
jgi:hypothetical protein